MPAALGEVRAGAAGARSRLEPGGSAHRGVGSAAHHGGAGPGGGSGGASVPSTGEGSGRRELPECGGEQAAGYRG